MIQFDDFFRQTTGTVLENFHQEFRQNLDRAFYNRPHGDMPAWIDACQKLPGITPGIIETGSDAIRVGTGSQLEQQDFHELKRVLRTFMPWRKGPWDLFGIHIDSEWRSDYKWNRIESSINSLKDRLVLDVGCGNSYYGFRMSHQRPAMVLGIDPTQLYLLQYKIFKTYLPHIPVYQLPLGDEDLPANMGCFDTVLSMGVIYHRREPLRHLKVLRDCMKHGGELILESLILKDNQDQVLQPGGRYAKMRNVWNIPGTDMLTGWVNEAGFTDARIIDITQTTSDEQRVTDWMVFESLANFLDPENPDLTIEGYPAPARAVIIARAI